MGGCQKYGPFLDPHYNTAPNVYPYMFNLEVVNGVRLLMIQASKVYQEGPLVISYNLGSVWVTQESPRNSSYE